MCPPASVPWATTMSTPMSTCLRACRGLLAERGDHDVALVRGVDDVLGRRPERVHEQRRRVLERDVDLGARGGVGPAEEVVAAGHLLGEWRHAVLGEHLLDPVAVLLADHLLELTLEHVGIDTFGQLHLGRHHEVDAVGLAVDVLLDPLQLDLELVGREVEGAEDAHTTRPADGGDDVAAVTEGEDRKFEAQITGELCTHVSRW